MIRPDQQGYGVMIVYDDLFKDSSSCAAHMPELLEGTTP